MEADKLKAAALKKHNKSFAKAAAAKSKHLEKDNFNKHQAKLLKEVNNVKNDHLKLNTAAAAKAQKATSNSLAAAKKNKEHKAAAAAKAAKADQSAFDAAKTAKLAKEEAAKKKAAAIKSAHKRGIDGVGMAGVGLIKRDDASIDNVKRLAFDSGFDLVNDCGAELINLAGKRDGLLTRQVDGGECLVDPEGLLRSVPFVAE